MEHVNANAESDESRSDVQVSARHEKRDELTVDGVRQPSTFIQWGRTRDNIDPVAQLASARGWRTVLIEHPEQLKLRRLLSAPDFDLEIPLDDPLAVTTAIERLRDEGIDVESAVFFPGFERYVASVDRARGRQSPPLDKATQRKTLRQHGTVMQPAFHSALDIRSVSLEGLRYPVVVKPTNGSYGSETYVVDDIDAARRALERVENGLNFDGRRFEGVVVEEFVEGSPCSMQGMAIDGRAHVLTVCEQSVIIERQADGSVGFREVGHLATAGAEVGARFHDLAQHCVDAFGYKDGPFVIDSVVTREAPFFLEMGFRLSGVGVVNLVREVGGYDWGELAFRSAIGERMTLHPPASDRVARMAQLLVTNDAAVTRAEQLAANGAPIAVRKMAPVDPARLWQGDVPKAAARDIERRPNLVGQLTSWGDDREQVIETLRSCAPDRLRFATDDPLAQT